MGTVEDGLDWGRPKVRSSAFEQIKVTGSVERKGPVLEVLVVKRMMGKKGKNARNDPKILL